MIYKQQNLDFMIPRLSDYFSNYLESDIKFAQNLKSRMLKDYEQYKRTLVHTVQPMPYREQFNTTCLFHLDVLARVLEDSKGGVDQMQDIHFKFHVRNNFYLCILTRVMNRIMIFVYKLNDRYRHERDSYTAEHLVQECTEHESMDVVFYKIHDASDEVKAAVRDHWVSRESGFFVNV